MKYSSLAITRGYWHAYKTSMCLLHKNSEEKHHVGVQIIGMSATLPNLDVLASWISADLYKTDFRPVPLTEIIKIGSGLYDKNLSKVAELSVNMAIKVK